MGCCSHVATLLWFYGNARHDTIKIPSKRDFSGKILNAANITETDSEQEVSDIESSDESDSEDAPE